MEFRFSETGAGVGVPPEELEAIANQYLKGISSEEQRSIVEAVGGLVTIGSMMGMPITSAKFAGGLRIIADILDRARPNVEAMMKLAEMDEHTPKN